MISRLRRADVGLPRSGLAIASRAHHLSSFGALPASVVLRCKCHLRRLRRKFEHATRCQAADSHGSHQSVASIVANVLKDRRQSGNEGAGAQELLDSLDLGVATGVVRSWDTMLTRMEVEGAWKKHPNARRMAMLAVFQERFHERAKLLYRAMQHVERRHPGYIAQQDLQRVYDVEKSNALNPAVECLGLHQLIQLCVALLPVDRCEELVEGVLGSVQTGLFDQAPYNRADDSRRQRLLQGMDRIRASMLAKVYLAKLRLRLADAQRTLSQPQGTAGAAAGGLSWSRGYTSTPVNPAQRSVWQREEDPEGADEGERLHFYLLRDLGGPGQGKVGSLAFRSSPQALDASMAAVGSASFACAEPREEYAKLATTLQMSRLLQSADIPQGVSTDVLRMLRTVMLDAIVDWAVLSPAIAHDRLPAECRHRITMRNREASAGAFSRGITLSAAGPALPLLRDGCLAKGVRFLDFFSPTISNPFADVTEWNYFREAAQVWTRFVESPDIDTVTLTILQPLPPAATQPVAVAERKEVVLKLSKPEFVAFVAMLTEYIAGDLQFSRQNWFPNDGTLQIRQCVDEQPPPSAVRAARGASLQAALEVRFMPAGGEQLCFSMSNEHIQSLVAMIDDMMTSVPGFLRLPPKPLTITTPGRGTALLRQVAASSAAALKTAAGAFLLMLPLLAILRPQGLLNPRGAAAAGLAPIATPTLRVSDATSFTDGQQTPGNSHEGEQELRQGVQPMNDQLSEAEMRGLCKKVEAQVAGHVWIPIGSARAEEMVFVYQVVVDLEGSVLGCSPANLEAVTAYQEMPLSGSIRGPEFAERQAQYLAALSPEALKKGGSNARKLAPAYVPVPWRPLPADGAVVLKLELRPDAIDRAYHNTDTARVDIAAASVRVVPWSDADSLLAWRTSGAVLADAHKAGPSDDAGARLFGSMQASMHEPGATGENFSASGDLSELLRAAQRWSESQGAALGGADAAAGDDGGQQR